jgi:hypothetical protein
MTAELLQIRAELARVRAERDRLAVYSYFASTEHDRPAAVIRRLSRDHYPGGTPDDLAAALAEHDRKYTPGPEPAAKWPRDFS